MNICQILNPDIFMIMLREKVIRLVLTIPQRLLEEDLATHWYISSFYEIWIIYLLVCMTNLEWNIIFVYLNDNTRWGNRVIILMELYGILLIGCHQVIFI